MPRYCYQRKHFKLEYLQLFSERVEVCRVRPVCARFEPDEVVPSVSDIYVT